MNLHVRLSGVLRDPTKSAPFALQRHDFPAFAKILNKEKNIEWNVDIEREKVMSAWSGCMSRQPHVKYTAYRACERDKKGW